MKILMIFLSLFVFKISYAQMTMSPLPVSGDLELLASSTKINFTNTTISPVTTNFTIDSNSAGIFISLNRCTVIKPKATCSITISFPNFSKVQSSIATSLKNNTDILANLIYNPQSLTLSSNFVGSTLAVDDFSNHTIYITNKTSSVRTYSPTFSGTDASKYSILLNRCINVPSGGKCSFVVRLSPQMVGNYSAMISEPQIANPILITSTITASTIGFIQSPQASISVTPLSLDFGTITKLGSTISKNIMITNNGNISISPIIALQGTGLQISLNRCLLQLGSGQSCSVSVYFNVTRFMSNGIQSGLAVSVKALSTSSEILVPITVNLNIPVSLLYIDPLVVNYGKNISAGYNQACSVASNKNAYCWGINYFGRLGNGSGLDSLLPYAVDTSGVLSGKTIKNIYVGHYHTCVIASDDQAYCWGRNSYGVLGDGTAISSGVPVAVYTGGVLSGKTIKSMALGEFHTCVIASDDQVYCWGYNALRQLGNNEDFQINSVVPVAVYTGGALSGKTIKSLSLGDYHSCAIASDDQVYCWGSNGNGQLGTGSIPNNYSRPTIVYTGGVLSGKTIKQISLGSYYTCAIASDDQVYCWGANESGQLGTGLGGESLVPTAVIRTGVLFSKTIKNISSGSYHSCVIASDDNSYCWGSGGNGELGNGLNSNSFVPVAVDKSLLMDKTIKNLSLNSSLSCAIASDDQAYCWGITSSIQSNSLNYSTPGFIAIP